MEAFQEKVKTALSHFKIYHYHPPDINMDVLRYRWSNPKDADFIVSNMEGKIGWLEIKSTSGKKFYKSSLDPAFYDRSLQLEKRFGTYYYIVHFKDIDMAFWFLPSEIEIGGFAPSEYRKIGYVLDVVGERFGREIKKSFVDLSKIPHFATTQDTA